MIIEYLLFNIIIILSSSIGVLLYRGGRWPHFSSALMAILSMSTVFLVYDQLVTGYWWEFNERYIVGLLIGKLPIEEVMFFLVIPWSCLCIWENIKIRVHGQSKYQIEAVVVALSIVMMLFSFHKAWWYTGTVSLTMILVGLFSIYFAHWLRERATGLFLLIVVTLTLVFNGYLTFRPVVIYNPAVISQVYLGTVPIEDVFYGLGLIAGVVMIYEYQNKNSLKKTC